MEPMKFLYFHQHFSTPQGATGTRSYEMARRLMARGHQVTMVCGRSGLGHTGLTHAFAQGQRRGHVEGIDVIEFDLAYSNQLSFPRRVWAFLLFAWRSILVAMREDYDVVFATTTPLTAGIPGIVARWLRRKTFVFEVRDLWPELPKAMGVITNPVLLWMMSVLEWVSYHSAHRLIGLSPGIVQGIAKRGIARELILAVPNGCDLDIFSEHADHWRPDGVTASDLMAIFTGTHGLANGLDTLIDVAIQLRNRGREDIKLVLVGDGMLKTRLQARAAQEGLHNIIFHDAVNKRKLAGLMADADLGLQLLANIPAFYYGTSPNKFFDYIAAGLPVLNNYPGWLAELIVQNQCGYAVPPDDPVAFANALIDAADHRDALSQMGLNARALARREYDRDLLAIQFVGWLEGAVALKVKVKMKVKS
jgi:glycosyltransferase involved in cell wall biosynthesis